MKLWALKVMLKTLVGNTCKYPLARAVSKGMLETLTLQQKAWRHDILRPDSFQDEVFLEEGKAFDNQVSLLLRSTT